MARPLRDEEAQLGGELHGDGGRRVGFRGRRQAPIATLDSGYITPPLSCIMRVFLECLRALEVCVIQLGHPF